MATVYKVVNLINGKSYIGATKTALKTRFSSHVCEANRGAKSEIYRAMREYGVKNFKILELEKCNEGEMFIREEILINKYDTMWPNGYNTSSSHLKGSVQSNIVKDKKSRAQKKRWKTEDKEAWSMKMKSMFSNPEFKKAHSDSLVNSWPIERRKKYSQLAKLNKNLIASRGYNQSGLACSKSVILYDYETQETSKYKSVSECARVKGWSIASVSKQIKTQNFLFEKYLVKFESNEIEILDLLEIAINKDSQKREKMSLAKKGKPPWNKGRRVTL